MKAPIVSVKHIRQNSLFTVTEGTIVLVTIVDAVALQDANTSAEVVEGAIVKAVFLEYWVMGEGAQPTFGNITVEKLPSGITPMTHTQSLTQFTYPNKKNILFTTQGLYGDSNSNPIPVIRQWIKIPKGKQRFGLGDKLVVNFDCTNPTADEGMEVCGTAIYKEYR